MSLHINHFCFYIESIFSTKSISSKSVETSIIVIYTYLFDIQVNIKKRVKNFGHDPKWTAALLSLLTTFQFEEIFII